MVLASYTYHTYSAITAPKIHTDLLWDLVVLFVGLAGAYFIAIFLFNKIISSKSLKVGKLKKELSPIISEFIFIEDDATKTEKSNYVRLKLEIRELLNDPSNRKIVLELLLELRKDVSGLARERLFELYQELGLDADSYKKLKSWRWQVVSQGIQELTKMGVTESYVFLTKFINDKRSTIRKQAELAVVTLKHEGLDYFLDTTKHKISEWQQLKLLEVISNKSDYLPPNFKAWLTSKNKYVVLFALRLIKHYNQNDADASIIELVKNRHDQIKKEAIECIKAFHLIPAIENLKAVFWNSTADTKIAILEALGELGSKADIEFLQLIDKKEYSFSVRSKALSAINKLVPGSILPTEGIIDTNTLQIPSDLKPGKLEEMKTERSLDDVINPTVDPMAFSKNENAPEVPIKAPAPSPLPENKAMEEASANANAEDYFELTDMPIYQVQMTDSITAINTPDPSVTYQEIDPGPVKEMEPLFQIDFLPIVIEAEIGCTNEKTEEVPQDGTLDINNMEVLYDQIEGKPESILSESDHPNEITIDLSFIPIVVDEQSVAPTAALNGERKISGKPLIPLSEIPIIYEDITVTGPQVPQVLNLMDLEVDFDVIQLEMAKEEQQYSSLLELEVQFEEVGPNAVEKLLDIEVIFETITSQLDVDGPQLPQWLMEEISASVQNTLSNKNALNPDWETKSFKMWQEIDSLLQIVPPPKYYDHEVAEKMILLDNIELYGDGREIELLGELMLQESDHGAQLRIREIRDHFLKQWKVSGAKNDSPDNKGEMAVYSVFEDFFRPCDTESKLILLDEIPAVGDVKDIPFLKKLLFDSDARIREKAAKSLAKLQTRLLASGMILKASDSTTASNTVNQVDLLLDALEIDPPKDSDIFEIDFEIGIDVPNDVTNGDPETKELSNETDTGKAKGSILQRICWFTSLLKPCDNG